MNALRIVRMAEHRRRQAARARAELFSWDSSVAAFLAAHEASPLPAPGPGAAGTPPEAREAHQDGVPR